MCQEKWMEYAIELAYENVLNEKGGPFAAIVVKGNKIIGKGTNVVTTSNDPTAHAEIQAIRDACNNIKDFQLGDCDLYTSCEPCPMCLGAIYWARPRNVYYYYTRKDAAKISFDDEYIYEQIQLPVEKRSIWMQQLKLHTNFHPFELWEKSDNKVKY